MTTHQGFPGLGVLATGDWLATYREATTHIIVTGANRGRIYGKTSSDLGATWSTAFTIVDDTVNQYDARDSSVLMLVDGTVLVGYFLDTGSGGQSAHIARSTNDAASFSQVAITSSFTSNVEILSGVGVELANGDVIWPMYGKDTGDTDTSVRVSRSTDGGATWSALAEVADGQAAGRSYQEPSLVLLPNADIVCFMRTDDDMFYRSLSTDDGATWSAPSALFVGSGRAMPFRMSAGNLVWLYRQPGNLGIGVARTWLAYSDDDGTTWKNNILFDLDDNEYCQFIEVSADALAVAYGRSISYPTQSEIILDYLVADNVERP